MANAKLGEEKTEDINSSLITFIPSWVNKDYFTIFLQQNVENFGNLKTLTVKPATKLGENYASNLMKITMEVEVADKSSKTLSYILKIPLPLGESETFDTSWSLYPKEISIYREILPRFKKLYHNQDIDITFAPKFLNLPKITDINENAILLEDLSALGFSLQNRLAGLDLQYTENVLKKLAEFHAVSARYVEVYGPYDKMFEQHVFSKETRSLYENVKIDYYYDYIKEYKGHEEYIDLIPNLLDNYLELSIAACTTDYTEFNVLNHGDFWLNNVMFKHSPEGKLQDTYFIDFQLCKYGSPTLDLYMFLLTGTQLDIKIKYFDYFVKIYYNHLVKHLKILKFNGKTPSLKELHMDLLKYGFIGFITLFNCLSVCLCEPKTDAECNMDFLMNDSLEAEKYRKTIFLNERFKAHAEVILPWLARRGLLK